MSIKNNQYNSDLEWLLRQPQFQRYVQHLLEDIDLMASTFTGNSQGMFLEGKRTLMSKLFDDMVRIDATVSFNILKESKSNNGEVNHG